MSAAPLRILQVNSVFNGGGTDNQTVELAAGLRDLGESITLAVAAGSRWEPLAHELGVRVETFAAKSRLRQALIRRLVTIMRQDRTQIIHAHQGRDYWPCILAARIAGCGTRVVVTRHLMTRPGAFSRWFLLSMSDVIAVSHAVAEVLKCELRGSRRKLHQIYGGIDPCAFDPERTDRAVAWRRQHGWNDDAIVFGVVGGFNLPGGKGQLEFLAAAARLRSEFPDARFAIVGRGSMETLLRERIADLGLAGIAVIVPFTDDIPTVMNALDVLVHPALGTEALGLVLLEAMAAAKPVIATRLDGIPEAMIEGEHGLLVPPGDVPALATVMKHLLVNRELRSRLGIAGRAHVLPNFSRQHQAERVRDLYVQLCGDARNLCVS